MEYFKKNTRTLLITKPFILRPFVLNSSPLHKNMSALREVQSFKTKNGENELYIKAERAKPNKVASKARLGRARDSAPRVIDEAPFIKQILRASRGIGSCSGGRDNGLKQPSDKLRGPLG